jgi:hypothetical protein
MNRYVIAIPLVVLLVFVLCLFGDVSSPAPASAQGQPGRCAAAVARLQQTVTAEARTYANARRTMCQYMSLSPDMREGRPQAINDSVQQNLATARQENAAAYSAASGCDISKVRRPEVIENSMGSVDAYISCIGPPDTSCFRLSGPIFDVCVKADRERRAARERGPCAAVLNRLDCESIKVADSGQGESEREPTVTVPGDLKPECRDAYLQFKAAEREYQQAQKRVRDLSSTYGAAGPRGTAMYNAARQDMNRAAEKQRATKLKLDECIGSKAEQPCEANFAGSYKADTSTLIISGSGSSLSATEQWHSGGRSGTNKWSNCTVTGNTAQCTWTGDYRDDPDKTADRSGTLTVTLNGDTLTGAYEEAEPKFHWKVAPYASAMRKGANWPIRQMRVGGTSQPCKPR